MKQVGNSSSWYLLHTAFLLGSFFNPEDEGDMLLQNVGWRSGGYMAIFPRI
jgi:hypothetical protein